LGSESLFFYAGQAGLDQDAFSACLDSDEPARVVMDDMQRGAAYGVRGTPAFFINGRVIYGAQPLEACKRTIDAALEEADGI
jgi:predicted DsbA family dithiol-disulfide isomerase